MINKINFEKLIEKGEMLDPELFYSTIDKSLPSFQKELFGELEIGMVLEGKVKNIVDFGAFIDLGGIDGLLHSTDISWGRIKHPSEKLTIGQDISIQVIVLDTEKKRVSLGMKQLKPHPWETVKKKYIVGSIIDGPIVSMTNYGVFIEIEPGVEGLVHVSEMSWTRKVKTPSELYTKGEEIKAKVLSIDTENQKLSLGVKQLTPDPWNEIEVKYEIGSIHKGTVVNLVQYAAFIELKKGIDGMVHLSDLSWTKVIKHPKEVLEKGQEIEVCILEVSKEDRKISLGYKQMIDDPWPKIISFYTKGKEISGEIIRVLDKGIIIQLDMDVEGLIPFDKLPKKKRNEIKSELTIGDIINGVVMEVKPDDKKVILLNNKFKE